MPPIGLRLAKNAPPHRFAKEDHDAMGITERSMMPIKTLRVAAELQRALDSVREWIDSFEVDKTAEKRPFIVFEEIASTATDIVGDGRTLSGWQGDLTMPRDVALVMLRAAEHDLVARLASLGVKDDRAALSQSKEPVKP